TTVHTYVLLFTLLVQLHSITCLFFFSSRRRHTRCYRDWSSDVCSSDLELRALGAFRAYVTGAGPAVYGLFHHRDAATRAESRIRSEERRVGKSGGRGGGRSMSEEEGTEMDGGSANIVE